MAAVVNGGILHLHLLGLDSVLLYDLSLRWIAVRGEILQVKVESIRYTGMSQWGIALVVPVRSGSPIILQLAGLLWWHDSLGVWLNLEQSVRWESPTIWRLLWFLSIHSIALISDLACLWTELMINLVWLIHTYLPNWRLRMSIAIWVRQVVRLLLLNRLQGLV